MIVFSGWDETHHAETELGRRRVLANRRWRERRSSFWECGHSIGVIGNVRAVHLILEGRTGLEVSDNGCCGVIFLLG